MESKRVRRKHTEEFKKGAVELVTQQGYSISKAARSLDLRDGQMRDWLHRLAPDWRPGQGPPSDDPRILREQLRQARRENEELRLERDILKKATAYFARPNP